MSRPKISLLSLPLVAAVSGCPSDLGRDFDSKCDDPDNRVTTQGAGFVVDLDGTCAFVNDASADDNPLGGDYGYSIVLSEVDRLRSEGISVTVDAQRMTFDVSPTAQLGARNISFALSVEGTVGQSASFELTVERARQNDLELTLIGAEGAQVFVEGQSQGRCGTSRCEFLAPQGAHVRLNADGVAAAGGQCEWSCGDLGTEVECDYSLTLDSSRTCRLTASYPLSVSSDGPGAATITIDGSFPSTACSEEEPCLVDSNREVLLTAVPNPGAFFRGWESNGTMTSTAATIELTMQGPVSRRAVFTSTPPAEVHRLSVVIDSQIISFGHIVADGTNISCPGVCESVVEAGEVVLRVIPREGDSARLDVAWGGACAGRGYETTLAVDTDKTCTVSITEVSTVGCDTFTPSPLAFLATVDGGPPLTVVQGTEVIVPMFSTLEVNASRMAVLDHTLATYRWEVPGFSSDLSFASWIPVSEGTFRGSLHFDDGCSGDRTLAFDVVVTP